MALISKLPGLWFEKYTSLQAEFGLRLITEVEKGDKVRQTNVHKVKNISEKAGLKFPRGSELGENVYWQFVSYFTRPFDAQKFFQKKKIDTSTTSLLQISNLPGSPYQGNTPNASHFHSRGLFIPAYPGLKNYEVEHIAKSLVESAQERLV
jgi:dTDP-4-amino-4,6-dideoxygalactose transaminase